MLSYVQSTRKLDLNFFAYNNLLGTRRIQLQSRRTTPAKEASTFYLVLLFVCSLETWNVIAWDGLVQQTGKYHSIRHMEYLKFQTGIFGRMESALNE